MANNYLFANLLLFGSGEGDKSTSLPFATISAVIVASSALLEVLISSLLPTGCTAKEAIFRQEFYS